MEIWDTSGEDEYAYQIFIDFEKQSVSVKPYDVERQEPGKTGAPKGRNSEG